MAIYLFSPRRHSSAGWNPEGDTRMVKGWKVLADGAFGCRFCVLSFPLCGNVLLNHWIPAFAGMTPWLRGMKRKLAGMSLGNSD